MIAQISRKCCVIWGFGGCCEHCVCDKKIERSSGYLLHLGKSRIRMYFYRFVYPYETSLSIKKLKLLLMKYFYHPATEIVVIRAKNSMKVGLNLKSCSTTTFLLFSFGIFQWNHAYKIQICHFHLKTPKKKNVIRFQTSPVQNDSFEIVFLDCVKII